jgi:hypothetical protein
MYRSLVRHRRAVKKMSAPGSQQDGGKKGVMSVRVMLIMTAIHLALLAPFGSLFITYAFTPGPIGLFIRYLAVIPLSLSCIVHSVNFLLYVTNIRAFRQVVVKALLCRCV